MQRVEINGDKLKEIRYNLDLPAKLVADMIDGSSQYLMNLEDARQSRTSTTFIYLHRLAMVYTSEIVAKVIVNREQRNVFLEQVDKRRQLISR